MANPLTLFLSSSSFFFSIFPLVSSLFSFFLLDRCHRLIFPIDKNPCEQDQGQLSIGRLCYASLQGYLSGIEQDGLPGPHPRGIIVQEALHGILEDRILPHTT
jgi:hypothetical protein